jgi:sugar/nucleoside kinase (ribokinase family)
MAGVVGIGLVALDVVVDERSDERLGAWAGGSCGNVLAILAWLGWDAAPVARLADDPNGEAVRADLERLGVDTRWLALGDPVPTPVYIERLCEAPDGTVRHRFDRFCPSCGEPLPGYQPVTRSSLGPVLDSLGEWDVVYIDRPSAAAVTLAEEARERSKLVFFEPSGRGVPRHMAAIAACAQIVKYSHDRLTPSDRELIAAAKPLVEIETLGARGLRFRTSAHWHSLRPLPVAAHDTAGAGDWTTAGILHELRRHQLSAAKLLVRDVREVLCWAQALGAWSCRFRAPRGAMDHHAPGEATAAAYALLRGATHGGRRRRGVTDAENTRWACSSCS